MTFGYLYPVEDDGLPFRTSHRHYDLLAVAYNQFGLCHCLEIANLSSPPLLFRRTADPELPPETSGGIAGPRWNVRRWGGISGRLRADWRPYSRAIPAYPTHPGSIFGVRLCGFAGSFRLCRQTAASSRRNSISAVQLLSITPFVQSGLTDWNFSYLWDRYGAARLRTRSGLRCVTASVSLPAQTGVCRICVRFRAMNDRRLLTGDFGSMSRQLRLHVDSLLPGF